MGKEHGAQHRKRDRAPATFGRPVRSIGPKGRSCVRTKHPRPTGRERFRSYLEELERVVQDMSAAPVAARRRKGTEDLPPGFVPVGP